MEKLREHETTKGLRLKNMDCFRGSEEEVLLLKVAVAVAELAHKDQKDKGGRPYIEHVLRVYNNCMGVKAKLVALLHDVLEDSPEYEPLVRAFPSEVVEAVECCTKKPTDSYMDYIGRIANNSIARQVKIADLTDNMDLSRLPIVTAKDRRRFDKYTEARALLLAKANAV